MFAFDTGVEDATKDPDETTQLRPTVTHTLGSLLGCATFSSYRC